MVSLETQEQKGLKSYDVEDVYAMVQVSPATLKHLPLARHVGLIGSHHRAQKRKAVILDIRPEDEFERGHAEGALNAPLFRLAQTQSRGMMLKKVAFALLAMKPRGEQAPSQRVVWSSCLGFGTACPINRIRPPHGAERNPTFLEDAERALGGKNKPFFIMCGTGGTMDQIIEGNKMGPNGPYKKKFNDPDRSFGRESRSLKAAYELYKAGFKNIMHVKGGFGEWRFRDLPVVD